MRPTLRASGSRDRVEAKFPDGDDPEEDEEHEHEHDELRLLERRLGLCRRERVQGRDATKGHDYADKEVEIERRPVTTEVADSSPLDSSPHSFSSSSSRASPLLTGPLTSQAPTTRSTAARRLVESLDKPDQ
jgi:hypothetical protein